VHWLIDSSQKLFQKSFFTHQEHVPLFQGCASAVVSTADTPRFQYEAPKESVHTDHGEGVQKGMIIADA